MSQKVHAMYRPLDAERLTQYRNSLFLSGLDIQIVSSGSSAEYVLQEVFALVIDEAVVAKEAQKVGTLVHFQFSLLPDADGVIDERGENFLVGVLKS